MMSGKPLCEVCGSKSATAIVGFRPYQSPTVLRWQFTCADEVDPEESESFSIAEFLASSRAAMERLAHLHQSGRIEWTAFMDMIVRLQAAMSTQA
jgi:hypothetical protein